MLPREAELLPVPAKVTEGQEPKRAMLPFKSLAVQKEELVTGSPYQAQQIAAENGYNAVTLPLMLRALKQRWMLAVTLATVAGVVTGGMAWLLVPTKYMAYSTLQVSMVQSTLIDKGGYRNDFSVFMKTQAARIKSRDVLLGALKQEQVRNLQVIKQFPDTVGSLTWLEDEIKVEFQEGNELLTLTVSGDNPEELVTLVNGLTNSYLNIITGKEAHAKKDRVKKLQQFVDEAREKIGEKIATRQGYIKGQGATDPITLAAKLQNYLSRLNEAQRELDRLQFDESKINLRIAAYKLMLKLPTEEDFSDISLRGIIEGDPVIKEKIVRLAKTSNLLTRMRESGTPADNSFYRAKKEEFVLLKKEIDEYRQEIRLEFLERAKKKITGDHKSNLEAMKVEAEPLVGQIKKLQDRIRTLETETENLGNSSAKVELITQDIQQDEKKLWGMRDQVANAQIEEESEPRVSCSQEAVWQVKDARRRLFIILLAPLFVCALVCLAVAWIECRMGKIQSAGEITNLFGIRVVGTIPPLKGERKNKIHGFFETDATNSRDLIESIDCIRTMILRRKTTTTARLILVTSATGGEGKSTFAYNMAVSLAATGKRTLLVDCDFRGPTLHHVFEQTLQPGVCEVLARELTAEKSIRPTTTHPNLSFIPAGQWDREVIQELATSALSEMIHRLKQNFDMIIIDSHPLLAAADSLLIAQQVDEVIISLLRNVSRAPWVGNALSKLAALEIPVAGAVMSGISHDLVHA